MRTMFSGVNVLTHEHLEMLVCIISIVATDALVLKHQGISIHTADYYSFYWISCIQKYHNCSEQH